LTFRQDALWVVAAMYLFYRVNEGHRKRFWPFGEALET